MAYKFGSGTCTVTAMIHKKSHKTFSFSCGIDIILIPRASLRPSRQAFETNDYRVYALFLIDLLSEVFRIRITVSIWRGITRRHFEWLIYPIVPRVHYHRRQTDLRTRTRLLLSLRAKQIIRHRSNEKKATYSWL